MSRSSTEREEMEEPLLLAVLAEIDRTDEEDVVVENEVASFEEESSLFISVMVAVDSEEGWRTGRKRRS